MRWTRASARRDAVAERSQQARDLLGRLVEREVPGIEHVRLGPWVVTPQGLDLGLLPGSVTARAVSSHAQEGVPGSPGTATRCHPDR